MVKLMDTIGMPFAESKCKLLGVSGTFLGVERCLENALKKSVVWFKPNHEICAKAISIIDKAEETEFLSPAKASKFRGMLNFAAGAMWGKIFRSFLYPLIQRSCWD